MLTDTIAAISTGGTVAGINIIRISGPKAQRAIKNIFTNYKKLKHQNIIYGKIIDPKTNKELDEVLVSCFLSPNSFTGEDVYEINCHGGRKITTEILDKILCQKDIRLAEPGEFSKRAFINGKIDLSKAEAIIDVINAKTSLQSKIATNQLNGKLFEDIRKIKEPLVEMLANIEVGIDYPEYEYKELTIENIVNVLKETLIKINRLIESYDSGKHIREGVNIVIIGTPNVGKSSLMNTLSKAERSIVTDIAGTTRDVIEQKIIMGNIELNISDTAGIRETEDLIENIGVNKSLKALKNSDMIILLLDASRGIEKDDINLINKIKLENKPLIICINKIDVSHEKKESLNNKIKEFNNVVEISAKTGEGIDKLEKEIEKVFNKLELNENTEEVVINQRHKNLLVSAKRELDNSVDEIKQQRQIDIVALSINEALRNIYQITGEDVTEDVIKSIFEKFCLGK